MCELVGLAFVPEDIGMKLLLSLSESIDICRANIEWLSHASLRLPVCIRTKASVCVVTIILDGSLVLISTAEDT